MAEKKKRDGRKPFHKQKRIGLRNTDPDFHYHCFTDKDNRIPNAKDAGYEPVYETNGIRGGEKDAADTSQMGKIASQHVGNGEIGYYMRIPKDTWEQDQKEKQKENDRVMGQIGILEGISKKVQRGSFTLESPNKTIKIEH
jgi:hypothetical protein